MKFQGKTAIWFYALVIFGNIVFLYEFIFDQEELAAMIFGAVIFNLVCIPMIARNYVIVTDDSVMVCFGPLKDSIMIRDIVEVRTTHDIIATTAASLDRISIKGKHSGLMCAVKDKSGFFMELKKRNPEIVIR